MNVALCSCILRRMNNPSSRKCGELCSYGKYVLYLPSPFKGTKEAFTIMTHEKLIRTILTALTVMVFIGSIPMSLCINAELIESIAEQNEILHAAWSALSVILSFMLFLSINMLSVVTWGVFYLIRAIIIAWCKHKRNKTSDIR